MNTFLNRRILPVLGAVYMAILMQPLAAQPAGEAGTSQSIGFVAAIRGDVEAIRPNNERRGLSVKSEIYLGDTISSGSRGRAQLHFLDDTVISVGRDTEIVLQDYLFDASKSDGALTVHVKEGVFRVMGGAITEVAPENFKTTTSTATIGIRGSFYLGRMKNSQLTVIFLGGKGIYVQNGRGTVDISQPGYGTTVPSADEEPEEPRLYSVEEITELVTEMTGGDDAEDEGDDEGADEGAGEDEGEAEGEDGEDEQGEGEGEEDADQGEGDEGLGGDVEEDDEAHLGDEGDLVGGLAGDMEDEDDNVWDTTAISGSDTEDFVDDQTTIADQSNLTEVETLPVARPNWWYGSVSGTAGDSQFDGATYESNQRLFTLQLNLESYESMTSLPNPGGYYYGTHRGYGSHNITTPDGVVRIVEITYANDNLGEFLLFTSGEHFDMIDSQEMYVRQSASIPGVPDSTASYLMSGSYLAVLDTQMVSGNNFLELGFSGIPSLLIPSYGIARYLGPGLITYNHGAVYEGIPGTLDLSVNFHNRKVLGAFTEEYERILFYYGSISSTGATELTFLGGGADDPSDPAGPGQPFTVSGSSDTFGFFGSDTQGVGFTGMGSLQRISDEQNGGNFRIGGGLFKREEIDYAPSGTTTWHGFAVGVAENIAAPDMQPRYFMNRDASEVALQVDRDAGSVTGFLTMQDAESSAAALDLQVGAGERSAYIHDFLYAAELDGNNSVQTGDFQGNLKQSGNFMITAPPEEKLSAWTSWGYWAVAYDDPGTGVTYDVHAPGALYVAGERTARSYIQTQMSVLNNHGSYRGGARCVEIGLEHQFERTGSSHFDVQFDTNLITGKFVFPELTRETYLAPRVEMSAQAAIRTGGDGFAGSIHTVLRNGFSEDVNTQLSPLQGDFYGPEANAIGGSFKAKTENINYIGVFGADKN